ncbi:molybdopterin molybdotransferase MoeA [Fontivita pretiosa]|uniref:molybdopterin molybdotransferase MoeA n=1 Tax=Fontivita pretiosa TaxID=2989684 RepID=UPI003D16E283
MRESQLISIADAIAVIDAVPVTPRVVRVRLEEAHGLYLAQDISADRDYPPFDKSLLDGFAVRCADLAHSPVDLRVVGQIAAGQTARAAIGPAEACAIMTGAPVPAGADGVVPVEDTRRISDTVVRILRAEHPSRAITPRGGDCPAGAVVLRRGMRLEAAQLAVAASVGAAEVHVFARPRAAVLSTGDELVGIDAAPGEAQIRNSNNIMLAALLRRLGCDVSDLGIVRDDRTLIRDAIARAISQFDVVFITGGMSMGQYDHVPKVLAELGVQLKITKVRIKPGKPFVFGLSRGRPTGAQESSLPAAGGGAAGFGYVFGLPGNPVSSFVCAVRLCSRLIARMSGAEVSEVFTAAVLESALEPNGVREFYQPAVLSGGRVRPLKWKGSADIYTLAQANALIVRPEHSPAVSAGQVVQVLEIPA